MKFPKLALMLIVLALVVLVGGLAGCPSGDNDNKNGNGGDNGTSPASFNVSNLTISPSESQPGDVVSISATVTNTGGTAGNYDAILNINNAPEDSKTINIGPGNSTIITFTVTKTAEGTYQVEIGSAIGSFAIEVLTGQDVIDSFFTNLDSVSTLASTGELEMNMTIPEIGEVTTTTTMEGEFDYSNRDFHVYTESFSTIGGLATSDIYLVDGWFYTLTSPSTEWIKFELSEVEIDESWLAYEFDNQANIDFFGAAELEIEASEVVNGIDCHKIVMTVTIEDFWDFYTALGNEDVEPRPEIKDLEFVFWIAKDTSYYIQEHFSFEMSAEGVTISVDSTTLYHSHNQALGITLPLDALNATDLT